MALGIGAWIARAGQGMVGTGSGLAPAYAVARTAAPAAGSMMQGAAAGAGFAAGQEITKPVKGVLGWFADLRPENLYSGVVVFAVLIYALEWLYSFDVSRTTGLRMAFAFVAFSLLMITSKSVTFWRAIISGVHLWSIFAVLRIWNGSFEVSVITSNVWLFAIMLVSGAFYVNLPVAGAIKWLPIVVMFDTYAMPFVREFGLNYAANLASASFLAVYFLNRILFPLPAMYSLLAFYSESRTARKILAAIILAAIVAGVFGLKAAYGKYVVENAEGPMQIEEEQTQGFLTSLKAGIRNIVSGQFLRGPMASAQEKLGEAFGFGTAKEQPKMGLQLIPDPNMPKVFNLREGFYDAAAPSIILSVPNPLPVDDPKKRVISIVGVDCSEEATASDGLVVEPFTDDDLTIAISKGKPAAVVGYKRPRTAKCLFSDLESGSHTVEFDVRYGFEADADLSTAFMSSTLVDALLSGGEDPAEVKKVPPARGEYDNGPVAITWGPVELVTSPVSLDAGKGSSVNLVVYVAGSGAWDGELAGIEDFTLTLPRGARFETDEAKKDDKNYCRYFDVEEGSKTYTVNKEILHDDKGSLRPVGDGVQFSCKMLLSKDVLGGADWAGATFNAHTKYVFSTKKTVSFEVEGCSPGAKRKGCTAVVDGKECKGNAICESNHNWGDCVCS